MEEIGSVFLAVVNLAKTPFTLYGFTLSCWQMFCWFAIAGAVIWVLNELFGG